MPVDMKMVIAQAYKNKVQHEDVDKITVKSLIEECHISRQTFYYHFQDIMEVIEWSMEQAARAMLEQSLRADTPEEALGILISSTLNNRELILRLMDSQKREQIEALFVRAVRKYLQEMIRSKTQELSMRYSDMEVALDFWAFGICGLLLQCCRKDHVDAENLAVQICRMIPGRS